VLAALQSGGCLHLAAVCSDLPACVHACPAGIVGYVKPMPGSVHQPSWHCGYVMPMPGTHCAYVLAALQSSGCDHLAVVCSELQWHRRHELPMPGVVDVCPIGLVHVRPYGIVAL
jgi:hypothetical protein